LDLPNGTTNYNFSRMGTENEYADYFISDAETGNFDIDIDPSTDLMELNDLTKKIDTLEGYDHDKLAAYLEWVPHLTLAEISNVIEELDKYDFLSEIENDAQFGAYCIRVNGVFDALSEKLRHFIDAERYGRYLRYKLDMYYSSLGVIIRIN
jgi:hypothetical protein